jgi:hypothetical protein
MNANDTLLCVLMLGQGLHDRIILISSSERWSIEVPTAVGGELLEKARQLESTDINDACKQVACPRRVVFKPTR